MMSIGRLALSALVASIVYLSGSLVFSGYNQAAYEELKSYVARLEGNVDELREQQRRLIAQAELYRRSSDAVAVAARALQYYESGQRVIRLDGSSSRAQRQSPGAILRRPAPLPDIMPYVRTAALLAFFVTFVLQVIRPGKTPSYERERRQEMRRASR